MKTSTLTVLALSALSGSMRANHLDETDWSTERPLSTFTSDYDYESVSCHTDVRTCPSMQPFSDELCLPGGNAQSKDYVPVERTAANQVEFDKAKLEGQKEANKITLNDPKVQILVVVVMVGLILGWRLERQQTLPDALQEYDSY